MGTLATIKASTEGRHAASRSSGVQAQPKAARLMPEIASLDTNTEHDVLHR
jgi:hypothetical protein